MVIKTRGKKGLGQVSVHLLQSDCNIIIIIIIIVTSGNRTPGSRFYSDLLDTSVCIHQLVLKPRSKR